MAASHPPRNLGGCPGAAPGAPRCPLLVRMGIMNHPFKSGVPVPAGPFSLRLAAPDRAGRTAYESDSADLFEQPPERPDPGSSLVLALQPRQPRGPSGSVQHPSGQQCGGRVRGRRGFRRLSGSAAWRGDRSLVGRRHDQLSVCPQHRGPHGRTQGPLSRAGRCSSQNHRARALDAIARTVASAAGRTAAGRHLKGNCTGQIHRTI